MRAAAWALIGTLTLQACSARHDAPNSNRFEVVRADDNAIWKVDRQTGEVWLCWVGPTGPVCRVAATAAAVSLPASAGSTPDFSHLWK